MLNSFSIAYEISSSDVPAGMTSQNSCDLRDTKTSKTDNGERGIQSHCDVNGIPYHHDSHGQMGFPGDEPPLHFQTPAISTVILGFCGEEFSWILPDWTCCSGPSKHGCHWELAFHKWAPHLGSSDVAGVSLNLWTVLVLKIKALLFSVTTQSCPWHQGSVKWSSCGRGSAALTSLSMKAAAVVLPPLSPKLVQICQACFFN